MSKAKPPQLVIDLCRALVEAGDARPTAHWFSIDTIRDKLAVPLKDLDVAVAWAVAHNRVRADGLPVHSLTVTYDGLTLSSRLARASQKRRPPSPGK
jgi:hypothetical protein